MTSLTNPDDKVSSAALFWVFTMQHLHIFFISYVLIGNLRLACCCDCSIGHEIAKKRLSQVGQQRLRWCVRSHRKIHQNSNFLRTHFCSSLCFMESERRLTFEPLTRVGEESIGYRRSFSSFEIHQLSSLHVHMKSVCMYARLNSLSMLHDWPDWP